MKTQAGRLTDGWKVDTHHAVKIWRHAKSLICPGAECGYADTGLTTKGAFCRVLLEDEIELLGILVSSPAEFNEVRVQGPPCQDYVVAKVGYELDLTERVQKQQGH